MWEGALSSLYQADIWLLNLLNLYYHPIFLDELVSRFTMLGILPVWLVFSGLLIIFGGEKGRKAGFLCIISVLLAYFLSDILKELIARPRPFYDVKTVMVLAEKGYSMPSGHSTMSFAACTLLGLEYGYLYLFLLFAALMGLSRIYLGVHYPSDVLAGALIGILCGVLVYKGKDDIISVMVRFKNKLKHKT